MAPKETPPPFIAIEIYGALVAPRKADGSPWDFCAACGALDVFSFAHYRDAASRVALEPPARWDDFAKEMAAQIGQHAGQHLARPDVSGWGEVARDGFTFSERQKTAHNGADDFTAWFQQPLAFRHVQNWNGLRVRVYLEDRDALNANDPIGLVVLTADMLEAARIAGRGVPIAVPVAQQGLGQVLFLSVSVSPDA